MTNAGGAGERGLNALWARARELPREPGAEPGAQGVLSPQGKEDLRRGRRPLTAQGDRVEEDEAGVLGQAVQQPPDPEVGLLGHPVVDELHAGCAVIPQGPRAAAVEPLRGVGEGVLDGQVWRDGAEGQARGGLEALPGGAALQRGLAATPRRRCGPGPQPPPPTGAP